MYVHIYDNYHEFEAFDQTKLTQTNVQVNTYTTTTQKQIEKKQ